MSELLPEAGPHAPAIREVVAVKRYSGITEPADDPAPAAPDPATTDRSRDLAELGDYVRLLADRMGLKDWEFAVEHVDDDDYAANVRFDDASRIATLDVDECFFGSTPERRRQVVARELVRCHFRDAKATDTGPAWAGVTRIAAAWAPCLPLPLVGWMRKAPLRGAGGGGER